MKIKKHRLEKKILFFSHDIKYQKEDLDYKLYSNLKDKINIDFSAASKSFEYYFKFSGYRKKKSNIIWCNNFYELKSLILNYDFLILSSVDGIRDIIKFSNRIGVKTIILEKYLNYDYDKNLNADFVILKNKLSKKIFLEKSPNFSGKIEIISFLDAHNKKYKKIKIKRSKKALFFLSGDGNFDNWYLDNIKKINKVFKKLNYKLFFKRHHLNDKIKYKDISKNFKNIKFDNFVKNIFDYEVYITFFSNIYQELNLNFRPIIFVDREKFITSSEKRKLIPAILNKDNIQVQNFSITKYFKKFLKNNIKYFDDSSRISNYIFKKKLGFKFFGVDLGIEQLENFIRNKKHLKFKIDKKFTKYRKELLNFEGKKAEDITIKKIITFIELSKISKVNFFLLTFYKFLLIFEFLKIKLNKF